ncbi:MAG: hypothetical protein J5835_02400 [Bacteroidales bacterium]|nr:hypothetical protein [Bacteroidales bacterium]
MKKALLSAAFAAAVILPSCNKVQTEEPGVPVPIVFSVPTAEFETVSKAVSEVTKANLSSVYVTATTGSDGSEELAWLNAVFTLNENEYTGNQYWPATDQHYHFYISNKEMQLSGGRILINVDSADDDVVYCFLASPGYKSMNNITLSHALARIDAVWVEALNDYTLSNVSVTITPYLPQQGTTFNPKDYTWDNIAASGAVELTNGSEGKTTNDFMFVPGSYSLTASWTATKGTYTENLNSTSGNYMFDGGFKTDIVCKLGGNAMDVVTSINVKSWSYRNYNVTF